MITREFFEEFIFPSLTRFRDVDQFRETAGTDEFKLVLFMLENSVISSSQIFQDLMVLYELGMKRNGFFVEFGACDGSRAEGSNTLTLEKRFGWQGILAEPCVGWHENLFANRSCYISTKCVHSKSGETVVFNEAPIRQMSTMEAYTNSDFLAEARRDGIRTEVETITLPDLLKAGRAPKRIDYMSIDTEGSELDILREFDFDSYDIPIITVEHNWSPARSDLYDLLTRNG